MKATYIGNCDDIVRDSNYSWRELKNGELKIGGVYEVTGNMCMQSTFIKQNNVMIKDNSCERYFYYKIINEFGSEIYIWENFIKICKPGDKCPHCKKGVLELVMSNEPYNTNYLQCDNCDSTYNL